MTRLLHIAFAAACTLIAGCYVAPYPYYPAPTHRWSCRRLASTSPGTRPSAPPPTWACRSPAPIAANGRITGTKAGAAVTIDVRPQADKTLQVIFNAPDSKETNPTLNARWLAVYNQRMGR